MLSASVATLDRLLKPVRATVAGRRKRRRLMNEMRVARKALLAYLINSALVMPVMM